LRGERGQRIRRYQYTAIDDATRVRALKVYRRHTQQNAIDFVDDAVPVPDPDGAHGPLA
jgi:hypothetical protein